MSTEELTALLLENLRADWPTGVVARVHPICEGAAGATLGQAHPRVERR